MKVKGEPADVLERCVKAIERGASLKECLGRYSELKKSWNLCLR